MLSNHEIANSMTIKLDAALPEYPAFQEGIRRAPDRGFRLTPEQTKVALKNALRYVPEELHETLAPEFLEELKTYGRIYAYRYRPQGRIYGKSIDEYKGKCVEVLLFKGTMSSRYLGSTITSSSPRLLKYAYICFRSIRASYTVPSSSNL